MSEERVMEALKALRDADRECEAGPQVEARLREAVAKVARRRFVPGRAARRWSAAGAAALAAAAAAVIMLYPRRVEPVHQAPPPNVVAVAPHGDAPLPALPVTLRKPPRARANPWVLREVTTDFYPLTDVAPPLTRGELVRVTVPASTMRDVGLDVDVDDLDRPVQADVLIGQEGLVRAIRFVSFEMKEKI